MGLSVAKQTTDFLLAGVLGAALSVLYDLFRIIRRRADRVPVTALSDGLFWLAAAAAFLWFSMAVMGGDFRLFTVLGVCLGAVFYFLTLSYLVLSILNALLDCLLLLLRRIIMPIAAFIRLLLSFFQNVGKSVKLSFKLARKKCMIKRNLGSGMKRRRK